MIKVTYFVFICLHLLDRGWGQCVNSRYDYIIVGAGTAGCVVANRLTKDPSIRVLVLERGFRPGPINDNPGLTESLAQNVPYAHRYIPLKSSNYCLGTANQRCKNIAGRATGGTSAVNTMFYTRGVRRDYDRWVEEHGAEGWGWDDILPYFVSLEDYKPKQDPDHPAYGTLGETIITYSESPLREKDADFEEAGTNMTQKFPLNGQTMEGFTQPLTTIDEKGRRHDAYNAYIEPIEDDRPNLTLITLALVTKIIIEDKKALGVKYKKNLLTCTARAEKEVILAAGPFESPHLLMVSGIGPKDELEKHKIDIIADLPVGQNLMDHMGTFGVDFIISQNKPLNILKTELEYDVRYGLGLVQYGLTGKGPWSLPSLVHRYGFVNIYDQPEGESLSREYCGNGICKGPSIEYLLLPTTPAGPPALLGPLATQILNVAEEQYEKVYLPKIGVNAFLILVSLLHPLSRGNLTLATSDIHDDPVINLNYFGHPHDMKTLIAGIKFAMRMVKTEPFDDLNPQLWDIPVKGCEKHKMWSDPYLECLARYFTFTYHHYSGTCKMGRGKDDPTAVVDPQLRVIGLDKLRVADTSIMPNLNTGHTQSTALVIGNKASHLILGKAPPPLKYF